MFVASVIWPSDLKESENLLKGKSEGKKRQEDIIDSGQYEKMDRCQHGWVQCESQDRRNLRSNASLEEWHKMMMIMIKFPFKTFQFFISVRT